MVSYYLQIYVDYVRPRVVNKSNPAPYVFLSYSGQQMQSGVVSKQMNDKLIEPKIFGDGKIQPKNITVSIIRKSATTGTKMAGFNREKEMAVLMAHDVSTAKLLRLRGQGPYLPILTVKVSLGHHKNLNGLKIWKPF